MRGIGAGSEEGSFVSMWRVEAFAKDIRLRTNCMYWGLRQLGIYRLSRSIVLAGHCALLPRKRPSAVSRSPRSLPLKYGVISRHRGLLHPAPQLATITPGTRDSGVKGPSVRHGPCEYRAEYQSWRLSLPVTVDLRTGGLPSRWLLRKATAGIWP
ncbi:hypothetical protein N657DRAFT_75528 [Parathielavia appendiculata]|uniref:Uncharacterized protein n=1 Tax=Parathielavia appendiculata TaxID=2587402 RepID=A0AAN6UAZ2_9PEZI|nr:hypothetical protein N657DRAFT_75528 [Parathielavia appendiculata]